MTCFGVDWHRTKQSFSERLSLPSGHGHTPPSWPWCVCVLWALRELSRVYPLPRHLEAPGHCQMFDDTSGANFPLIYFLVPRLGPSSSRERPCHFHSESIRVSSTANHHRWCTHRTQMLEKVGWAEQHRTLRSSQQMYRRTRWRQFRGHSSFVVCPKLPKWNAESLTACQEMTNCTFSSLSVPLLMPRLSPVCDTLFCTVKIQTSLI